MKIILKTKAGVLVARAMLYLYAIVSLYPLLWAVLFSFKNNEEIFVTNVFGLPEVWRVENYVTAWTQFNVVIFFRNSLIVTICTVIITITATLMFSYATARMRWRFQTTARILLVSGMFIPVQIVLIPLVILARDIGITNSLAVLIFPYSAFQLAFSSLVFYGFFRTIPFEIEEAAVVDGAGIFTVFWSIMVPLVKPAMATMAIFVSLFSWNEFIMALILITRNHLMTLPLGLLSFQGQFETNWGAMGAAMVIASLPTVALYLVLGEQVEKALTVGGALKG